MRARSLLSRQTETVVTDIDRRPTRFSVRTPACLQTAVYRMIESRQYYCTFSRESRVELLWKSVQGFDNFVFAEGEVFERHFFRNLPNLYRQSDRFITRWNSVSARTPQSSQNVAPESPCTQHSLTMFSFLKKTNLGSGPLQRPNLVILGVRSAHYGATSQRTSIVNSWRMDRFRGRGLTAFERKRHFEQLSCRTLSILIRLQRSIYPKYACEKIYLLKSGAFLFIAIIFWTILERYLRLEPLHGC